MSEQSTSEQSPRIPSILLAEDDPVLRKLLTALLKKQGFHVVVATDGQNALDLARKHVGPIDLLVTDVMMPKLDGFDLHERLQQERSKMRVLVMSSALGKEIKGEDFALLRKPFQPDEFVAKVKEVLASPV